MAVTSEVAELDEWGSDHELHFWQRPRYLQGNIEHMCFVARRSNEVIGRWVIPITRDGNGLRAIPDVRLFPYAAPALVESHPRSRREAIRSLMRAVTNEVSVIGLPLQPWFGDLGAFSEFGAFCEARHTHVFNARTFGMDIIGSSAKNHFRNAEREVKLTIHADAERFRFDEAIVDNSALRVARRKDVALRLAQDGLVSILEATKESRIVGQLLIALSGSWAVFMHTWFDRIHAPRGTPTFLCVSGAQYCFDELKATKVDLEGSVIAKVDEFMDGLGAQPVVYPVIYWARNPLDLLDLLRNRLSIPGRSVGMLAPDANCFT